jgi:hypothetical protein
MTNDNKPPMFGTFAVIDPATYEPRSGKSALMNELMAELAGKPKSLAGTIIGNCTTTLIFRGYSKDNAHTLVFGSARNGMSAMFDTVQDQYVEAGGPAKVIDKGPTTDR